MMIERLLDWSKGKTDDQRNGRRQECKGDCPWHLPAKPGYLLSLGVGQSPARDRNRSRVFECQTSRLHSQLLLEARCKDRVHRWNIGGRLKLGDRLLKFGSGRDWLITSHDPVPELIDSIQFRSFHRCPRKFLFVSERDVTF